MHEPMAGTVDNVSVNCRNNDDLPKSPLNQLAVRDAVGRHENNLNN